MLDVGKPIVNFKKVGKSTASTKKRRKIEPYGKVITSEEFISHINDTVNKDKNISKRKIRKKNKIVESESESSSKKDDISKDDDDGCLNEENWATGNSEDEVELNNAATEIKVGDYILVSFKGGKRNAFLYKYVCTVSKINEPDIKVMELKSLNSNKSEYKLMKNDISVVDRGAILGILPIPQVVQISADRVKYVFSKPVPVVEK